MKVLILGGSGMLGHRLWLTCSERFDTYVTFRGVPATYLAYGIFDPTRALGGVIAQDLESIQRAFDTVRPDVVVNCIGVVKQDAAARDARTSIAVNALLPHQLAQMCGAGGMRLIHLSTDCVFSGRKGNYDEQYTPDAEDLYGRTKLLGEVTEAGCLTIRTSMIGRELVGAHGLFEWFLSQNGGKVRGFRRAIFSGFTTAALASIITEIIHEHQELEGLYHIAAEPITKFDLLSRIKKAFDLTIDIEPDDAFSCDRSLDGARFREVTGIVSPGWSAMISELREDPTPYEELRRTQTQKESIQC